MSAGSSSRKRVADKLEGPTSTSSPTKISKANHPFFLKPSERPPTAFVWNKTIDGTCRHGVHLAPSPSCKIAAFDLDGTLIKTKSGNDFPRDQHDWMWWNTRVPQKLRSLHEEGYAIVIISNQATNKQKVRDQWKQKIPLIAKQIPDIPFRIFAALEHDAFRKPMPGMWMALEKINTDLDIDKSHSFFVGDAAGRSADHADTDIKWALNIGIPFFTPEEFFLASPPMTSKLKGFNPSSLPDDLPLYTPTSSPLVPAATGRPELVLFVGYPASGKTSLYRRYFKLAGYEHVNQDLLKTRNKCKKAVESFLKKGKSCVVDNTNRNVATRKEYLDLCGDLNVPVRCIYISSSLQLSWHNNLYRAFCLSPSAATQEVRNYGLVDSPINLFIQAKRGLLPPAAFMTFRADFVEPTLDEGFVEIKRVNWRFEGDEEERKWWNMWLEIDKIDWLGEGD